MAVAKKPAETRMDLRMDLTSAYRAKLRTLAALSGVTARQLLMDLLDELDRT
jgi:hypothetical protein